MTREILDHAGFVDKYMGDAIMAFWNAPLPTGDHPAQACRTALAMRRVLAELNAQWHAEFAAEGRTFPGVAVGVGLHTGVCCVGNMGAEQRFDYSVLGDNVNLTSRLEGQSKTYGVDIVVSEATRAASEADFATLELDLIRVKGRREPARIHTLLGGEELCADLDFRAFKGAHDTMLAAYRAQDWDGADAARVRCEAILAENPSWLPASVDLGGLYALYAERLATLRRTPPPPDWDAVFTAETK
jgi:adenylate cyclase